MTQTSHLFQKEGLGFPGEENLMQPLFPFGVGDGDGSSHYVTYFAL